MLEFIQKYWIQVIFSGILGVFSLLFRRFYIKATKEINDVKYLKDGVKALLFDRLRQSYNYHMKNGYIVIDEFRYWSDLYKSYHDLGGNGTGTEMLERLKELPPNPPNI